MTHNTGWRLDKLHIYFRFLKIKVEKSLLKSFQTANLKCAEFNLSTI